jgi:predicted transcriptional regulator
MVKYSDTKLVPKEAKVLGFIRGMIKNNQKNPKMKVFNKVWMKETTQKIAFLLGMGESTIKDHIKHLVEKGYLQRANLTDGLDNTNWYWIDEIRIDKDYTDYLSKLELELNQLSMMCELDSNLPEVTNSKGENKLRSSQNLANDNLETNSTILYNSNRILNNTRTII